MIKNHLTIFIFILFVFAQITVEIYVCGGNCPDKSCKSCICGQSKLILNIDEYCSRSKLWDVNCCKCIANRASGGNAHYMKFTPGTIDLKGWYDIGALPTDTGACYPETITDSQLCDSSINFKCAQASYSKFGWLLWQQHAFYCGCKIHKQIETIKEQK